MAEKQHKDDVQKTQVISPGNLGEQANRKKESPLDQTSADKVALEQGLNEEKSEGNSGAFEGFEDPSR